MTVSRALKRVITFLIMMCLIVACRGDILAYTLKSKYFNLTAPDNVDKFKLLEKLKVKRLLHLETNLQDGKTDLDALLAEALDTIYLEICDTLDIHVYSMNIDLEIVQDKNAMRMILKEELKQDIAPPSLYIYDKNKIYISLNDMTLGMLAHEIAHSIISHYFVVTPPTKVQEILSGYAEYSIRKVSGEDLRKAKGKKP